MPLDWAGAWSVVMRWDLSSEGCRFKSQYSILDGLFENIFIIKIVCLKCLFEKTKVNEKEAGDGKGRHVLCWLSYNMMQSVVFKCETVFYVKPPTTNLSKTCFKKIVPTPASFSFIFVFSNNHHYDFYNKYMWKNFHPIHGAVNRTHNLRNVSLFP